MQIFLKYVLLLLVIAVLSACAPVVAVKQERYLWPSPPNTPRIEWLGAYSSQLDLKMTQVRRMKEFFVGEESPISLKRPVEVRSDPVLDKIYIADVEAGCVYVYDLRQGDVRMLSTSGSNLPERISPSGLALDGEQNLYVLEPRYQRILVYDSAEKYLRSINIVNKSRRPVAVAIDKDRRRLYVSDVTLNKITAFDLNGTELFSFGGSGTSEGLFNKPVGIAIASNGDIIIADAFNARIQVFNASGKFLRMFGKRGDGIGNFQLIKSVAVDPEDNIYVVDARSHVVNVFNQSGDLLTVFGSFYSVATSGKQAPGGFAMPVGIDIDSRGRIHVVDQLNSRIQFFQYLPETSATATQPPSMDK